MPIDTCGSRKWLMVPFLQDGVRDSSGTILPHSPVRMSNGSPARRKGEMSNTDMVDVANPVTLSRAASANSDISRGNVSGPSIGGDFARQGQYSPHPHQRGRLNTGDSQCSSALESVAMQNFRKNLLMFYDDMDAEEDAIAASNREVAGRRSTDSAASSVQSDVQPPCPPGWQVGRLGFFSNL